MRFFADLHIHSKYSRATSRDCDLEHLSWWAQRKGITVVGTGDFTHPAWWQEIQDKLAPAEPGLFRLRPEIEREVARTLPASCRRPMRFMLEVEISTIYKKGEKTRKVHHLIYAGSMATASRFRDKLGSIGNIASDGRPILGLDSRHLLEITLASGPDAFLVPAHIWTPWFAAMGSKSGFDSIDECYGDLAEHIFAVETGLSSDPPMNWRVSHLDRFTLVSSSDAHSPPMIGREASVYDCDLDYFAMRQALETGRGFGGTVEFFPEEGKYHMDGHRACKVRLEPAETEACGGRCPTCGKPITVGVLHRVETLADRPLHYRPADAAPFDSLVPLPEIAGEIHGVGPKTKTVARTLDLLTDRLGSEYSILFDQPIEDIERATHPLVAEAIRRLRRGEIRAEGGYDGEYGTVRLFEDGEIERQMALFAFTPPKVEPRQPPKAAEPAVAAAEPAAADVSPVPKEAVDTTILGSLDADQRRAAEITSGSLLIVAGPGSGKTRTLTHRIAHLIESGVTAAQCLAVTFSRRAADEMRERLDTLLEGHVGRPWVTTFHALGLRILGEQHDAVGLDRGFAIADERARLEIVRGLFGLTAAGAVSKLRSIDAHRRPRFVPGDAMAVADPAMDDMVSRYRAALRERDLVDWGELIERPVELLGERDDLRAGYRQRWPHLSVDEYQDIDGLQYRLVRLLAPDPDTGSLCAIGDPDQSIYAFRGADVSFFLRFQQDEPEARIVELGNNYRSQPTIVRAAAAVIRPSSMVPDRHLDARSHLPSRPIAMHQAVSPRAEAEFVVHTIERLLGGTSHFSFDSGRVEGEAEIEPLSFSDIAILYRTRAQAAPLIEALDQTGMPYQERSHDRLADRDDVRVLVHEAETGSEIASGIKVADVLTAAAGRLSSNASANAETALELLARLATDAGTDWATFRARIALGAEVDTWDPRAERIALLTLHAAKGLEFPVVFLVGCEDGLLPYRHPGSDPDVAEERRLLFVGMTRAERLLHLSWSRRRSVRGEALERVRAPFLDDIDPADLRRVLGTAKKATKPRASAEQLRLL